MGRLPPTLLCPSSSSSSPSLSSSVSPSASSCGSRQCRPAVTVVAATCPIDDEEEEEEKGAEVAEAATSRKEGISPPPSCSSCSSSRPTIRVLKERLYTGAIAIVSPSCSIMEGVLLTPRTLAPRPAPKQAHRCLRPPQHSWGRAVVVVRADTGADECARRQAQAQSTRGRAGRAEEEWAWAPRTEAVRLGRHVSRRIGTHSRRKMSSNFCRK